MIPLRDDIQSQRLPVVMGLLILVNLLAFVWEITRPPSQQEAMFQALGLVPANYESWKEAPKTLGARAAVLPFITHMFMHAGLLHVLSNMWFLWIFGDNVEDRFGHLPFLIFYLICGLTAACTQLLLNRSSTVPMVGASGAIAGVLGAYMLLYPLARITVLVPIVIYPLFFRVPALLFIVAWFGLQLYSGTQSLFKSDTAEGVAWWAHVGGFGAGVVLCPLLARRRRR
jgi:membrane associated rhomboid family serine protease